MSRDLQREIWSAAADTRKGIMVRYLVPMWTGVLDAAGAKTGTKLLDAGCGTGELSAIALERGSVVTGIDNATRMIELCRADPKLAAATFFEGTIESLPFESATFDAAVASMSVHFCDDVPRALGELFRVLAPGGRVVISAPAHADLDVLVVFALALEHVPPEMADDIRRPLLFTSDGSLATALTTAGFGDIDEQVIDTPLVGNTFDEIWEAQKTWAPVQLAASFVGEEAFLEEYQQRLNARLGDPAPTRLDMKFRVARAIKR
ncbi:MAG: class I SAM-dependent methyltransferase [Myxococcota bacterium]|nr:class I SAM-dependent methyltransferase [Deltaproteobacteria bacterium]MDQ3334954.1 class I SAM-dependent methyltransferase [Myxococcota bacterium]